MPGVVMVGDPPAVSSVWRVAGAIHYGGRRGREGCTEIYRPTREKGRSGWRDLQWRIYETRSP